MWRPCSMYFRRRSSLPERLLRDGARRGETLLDSAGEETFCIPFPPRRPPLDEDRPADPVAEHDHLFRVVESSMAGVTGTPEAESALRAWILSPMIRMTRAGGPMNVIFSRFTASAKSGFSARKPYPGKIASHPSLSPRADRVDIEVAHGGGRRPQAHRLVGELYVERQGVAVGVPTTTGILSSRAAGWPGRRSPSVRDEYLPEAAHSSPPTYSMSLPVRILSASRVLERRLLHDVRGQARARGRLVPRQGQQVVADELLVEALSAGRRAGSPPRARTGRKPE